MVSITVALLAVISTVVSKSPVYGPCSVAENHLDNSTKIFISDCDTFGYCASNGTCLPRGCRRDQYVLSSQLNSSFPVPPLCTNGTFCPDDASACTPQVGLGQACQLNRDEQCRPQPGSIPNTSSVSHPVNTSKAAPICLEQICVVPNIQLNASCILENTTYSGMYPDGGNYGVVVIRDNCVRSQAYCDPTMKVCKSLKVLNQNCTYDHECISSNCASPGCCSFPTESSVHVPAWMYGLVAFALAGATAGVLAGLVWLHQQRQKAEELVLREYIDQLAMRKDIDRCLDQYLLSASENLEKEGLLSDS